MPKKTKNGFVLIEAMVVLAFLATTLLSIYTSFNNVLDRTKKKLYYDDPVYLYRTYNYLSYLERNGLTEYIDEKFNNTSGTARLSILEYGCKANLSGEYSTNSDKGSLNTLSEKSPKFCEEIKSDFEVEHIYIMHYDVNEIINCTENLDDLYCTRNSALRTFSNSAVDYLYTLDGYTTNSMQNKLAGKELDNYLSGYRIVIEFKRENETQYTYYSNLNSTSTANTKVVKSDYYYATLEVPYGTTKKDSTDGHHTED